MFRHVVMFRWLPGTTPEHLKGVVEALDRLGREIPTVRAFAQGSDAGVNAGNFDHVVVADFDSAEDYLVYRDHPEHQRFIAEFIKGHIAERAAVQYRG